MFTKKCYLVAICILFSVGLAIADPPAVHPTTGEPLVIDCYRGTPDAIDGDLSDWDLDGMTPAVLDAAEQVFSGQENWTGSEDCGGEFYLLWDDVNIYIAVVVQDDKLSTNKADGNIWNADAVEVFFSTLNAIADHSEHYQYGFNAINQKWNWCNIDGAGSTEPAYLQIAAVETADGYICEASVEYAQMPSLDFSAGNTIGFHPVFDDTDNGDRELQMTWTGREAHDQSLGFGHLVLSADPVPTPEPVNPGIEGLVASYALAGDANDSSGNSNDGTIHNADTGGLGDGGSVWVDDPERGTVISFNGTAEGAHVRAGEIPQMTLTNDFTWSFWAKQDANNTTPNDIILGNRMDPNAVDFVPRQFIKFTPTKFEWHMNGNGDDNLEYDDIPGDVWLHHAVVKTADVLTYYRNGIEASSGMITQPLDVPQPLFFGGDNEGSEGENWAGLMSDVNIYNRALDAGEVMFLAGLRATPVNPGADGLAAYYALESDASDGSGNGNDGTIVGAPTSIDGPAGYGMAMEFHGLGAPGGGGDYIDCGNDASLNITGPISMGLWIKPGADDPEGQGTETAPMAKAMSGIGWSWQVRYGWNSPEPYMAFTFNSSPRAWAYVGRNLDRDEWAHIACSHDGETLKCYLDGEQTDSTPMGQIASSDAQVLIGSDGWGCDWIGGIDEVAIYNRGLSDGEVRYLAGFRDNLLQNSSFEEDEDILDDPTWEQWCTWNPAEGAGSNATIVDTDSADGARSLLVEPIGPENWHFILVNISFAADLSKNYTTSFWAKAAEPRPLTVQMKASDNSVSAWGGTGFDLTTEWAQYSYTSEVQHTDVKLEFLCAGSEVSFWLDQVLVYVEE